MRPETCISVPLERKVPKSERGKYMMKRRNREGGKDINLFANINIWRLLLHSHFQHNVHPYDSR